MRILLLNISEQAPSGDFAVAPLGVLSVAGWIMHRELAEVSIRDLQVDYRSPGGQIKLDELTAFLKNYSPDIVGVSFATSCFDEAARICKLVKFVKKNCVVVVGGIHSTIDPSGTMKEIPQIDYLVRGEGEIAFENLVRTLEKSQNPNNIRSLCFHEEDRIQINPKEKSISDLDQLPLLPWSLLSGGYNQIRLKIAYIMTTRGCPNCCTFCSTPATWGGNCRGQSAKRVCDEIDNLLDTITPKFLFFGDDTFTFNRKRTIELCNELKHRDFGLQWSCQTRADCLDDDLLLIMKEAGCVEMTFGIESASDWIRNEIYKKKLDLPVANAAIQAIKKTGIRVGVNFIIGPYDSRESVGLLRDFVEESQPDFMQINVLELYPGLAILSRLKRDGLLKEEIPGRKWSYYLQDQSLYRLFAQVNRVENWLQDLWIGNSEILFCDQDKSTQFMRLSTKQFQLKYLDAILEDRANLQQMCQGYLDMLKAEGLIIRNVALPNLNISNREQATISND